MVEMHLDDTGTRFSHYSELLDWWEEALAMIRDNKLGSTRVAQKKQQLDAAIVLLRHEMDTLANFRGTPWQLDLMYKEAQLKEH